MPKDDQVPDEVDEQESEEEESDDPEQDQSSDEQSEQTDDKPKGKGTDAKPKAKTGGLKQIVKGLQKGYTMNRQEMSDLKGKLDQVLDKLGSKDRTADEDEDFVTASKLKSILAEHSENTKAQAQAEKDKNRQQIDQAITDLQAQGIIKSKDEKDELLNFAIKIKEGNLYKAADIWKEVKKAEKRGMKQAAKKKVKKEAGSKVGNSQKAKGSESGVSYEEIHNMDMDQIE